MRSVVCLRSCVHCFNFARSLLESETKGGETIPRALHSLAVAAASEAALGKGSERTVGHGTIYFHRRKLQKLVSTPVGIGNINSKTIFTDQHQIITSMSTDHKSCQINNVIFSQHLANFVQNLAKLIKKFLCVS